MIESPISPFYPSITQAILFHRTHRYISMPNNTPAMLIITRGNYFKFLNVIRNVIFWFKNFESIHH